MVTRFQVGTCLFVAKRRELKDGAVAPGLLYIAIILRYNSLRFLLHIYGIQQSYNKSSAVLKCSRVCVVF